MTGKKLGSINIETRELDLTQVIAKTSMAEWGEALKLLSGTHILPYAAARYELPDGGVLRVHHKTVNRYPDPQKAWISVSGGSVHIEHWVRLDRYGKIRHANASLNKADRIMAERLIQKHLLAEAAISERPFNRETTDGEKEKDAYQLSKPKNNNEIRLVPIVTMTVVPDKTVDVSGASCNKQRREFNHQIVQRAHMGHRWKGSRKDGTLHLEMVQVRQGIKHKDKPKVLKELVSIK